MNVSYHRMRRGCLKEARIRISFNASCRSCCTVDPKRGVAYKGRKDQDGPYVYSERAGAKRSIHQSLAFWGMAPMSTRFRAYTLASAFRFTCRWGAVGMGQRVSGAKAKLTTHNHGPKSERHTVPGGRATPAASPSPSISIHPHTCLFDPCEGALPNVLQHLEVLKPHCFRSCVFGPVPAVSNCIEREGARRPPRAPVHMPVWDRGQKNRSRLPPQMSCHGVLSCYGRTTPTPSCPLTTADKRRNHGLDTSSN